MKVDLTSLIVAIIGVLTAALVRFVIPWLKSKTTETQRTELLKWVDIAVTAAQQLYYDLSGPERKKYVLDFLSGQGFDVNDPEINAAIESAVLELHHWMEQGTDES